MIGRNPSALQLRYLQTLVEIAAEKLHHDFPIPVSYRYDRPLFERADPEVDVAIESVAL